MAMSFQSNKAVEFDSVSYEMLKYWFNQLQNCLIKVFSSILSNGTYLIEWKMHLLHQLIKAAL